MRCPYCENGIPHHFVVQEKIVIGDYFRCPSCGINLHLFVDETTYNGAKVTSLAIADRSIYLARYRYNHTHSF